MSDEIKDTPSVKEDSVVVYGATFRIMDEAPDMIKQCSIYSILTGKDLADIIQLNYLTNIFSSVVNIYNYAKERKNVCADLILFPQIPRNTLLSLLQQYFPLSDGKQHYIKSYSVGMPPFRYLIDKAKAMAKAQGYNYIKYKGYSYKDGTIMSFKFVDAFIFNVVIDIDLKTYIADGEYLHNIVYAIQDSTTKVVDISTITDLFINVKDPNYPEFNMTIGEPVDSSLTIPIILLGRYIDDDKKDTKEYKETKEMLRKLHLRVKDFHKAINEDKQFDRFQYAYLTLHTDLVYDNVQGSLEYIIEFFKRYYQAGGFHRQNYIDWADGVYPKHPELETFATMGDLRYWRSDYGDALLALRELNTVTFDVIDKVISDEIGYCKKLLLFNDGSLCSSDDGDLESCPTPTGQPEGLYVFRQISATQCEQLYIANCASWGLLSNEGMEFKNYIFDIPRNPADPPLQNKFLIPFLPSVLVHTHSFKNKSDAFYQSMKVSLLGSHHEYIPWYRSKIFNELITAVELVAAIITQQWEFVVMFLATTLLNNPKVQAFFAELLKYTIKADPFVWLLERLGVKEEDIYTFVQIEIAAVGFYFSYSNMSNFITEMVTSIANSAVVGVENLELQEWQEDFKSFEESMYEKSKEIKRIRKENNLDNKVIFGDITLRALYEKIDMYPNEDSIRYINRKLNTENSISKSINVVYRYHDTILDLNNLFKMV